MPQEFDREKLIKEFEDADLANEKRVFNFHMHGKRLQYDQHALWIFSSENRFRQCCVWLMEWKPFSWCMLAVVVANTVLLGFTDYSHADGHNTLRASSWRNKVVMGPEPLFAAIYVAEAVVKIVGMGFAMDENAYCRSVWNLFDFVIAVTALLASIPAVPAMFVLQAFRMLRPLRCLGLIPGMRVLVTALLIALPSLMNVLLLLVFFFALFGILGVQLLVGAQHGRCRLTEFPVMFSDTNSSGVCASPYSTACNDVLMLENVTARTGVEKSVWSADLNMHVSYVVNGTMLAPCVTGDPNAGTSKTSSIWVQSRDCFWPLDVMDTLYCSLSGRWGRRCGHGRWCGSNYDDYGNQRFSDPNVQRAGTFIPELDFGYTVFDNFMLAALTVFQSITLEGWSDVMYQLMDAYNPVFGVVFMIATILIGAFFMINLMLSVIWSSFEECCEREFAKEEYEDRKKKGLTHVVAQRADYVKEAAKAFAARSRLPGGMLNESRERRLRIAPHRNERSRRSIDVQSLSQQSGVPHRRVSSYVPQSFRASLFGERHVQALASEGHTSDEGTSSASCCRRLCPVYVHLVQRWCAMAVSSKWFNSGVAVLILANAIVLACDHYPSSHAYSERLEILNFTLTLLFLCDLLMKLIGLGPRQYLTDAMNRFDCFVVVMSVVELCVVPPSFVTATLDVPKSGGFSVFRVLRLIRVIRLVRLWSALGNLIDMIVQTLTDVANIAMMLLLLVYVFALVGMQLFATRMCFDDVTHLRVQEQSNNLLCRPRSNFDTVPRAVMTVFQLLTTENWNFVMYDAWRAVGWLGALYFVTVIVMGHFIALNLFLAILLENFEELGQTEAMKARQLPELQRRNQQLFTFASRRTGLVSPVPADLVTRGHQGSLGRFGPPPILASVRGEAKRQPFSSHGTSEDGGTQTRPAAPIAPIPSPVLPRARFWWNRIRDECQSQRAHSLYLFREDNWFRLYCGRLIRAPQFEWLTLLVILYSCVMLALDNPLNDPNSMLSKALHVSDVLVTVLFTVELLIKVVACGAIVGDDAYFTSLWNWLDAVIVCVSLASFGLSGSSSLNGVKAVRALRALRPLRVITKFPALRLSVDALLGAIPSVISVIIVAALLYIIFGAVCVQYFKGALNSCQGSGMETLDVSLERILLFPVPYHQLTDELSALFATTGYPDLALAPTGKLVCLFLSQALPGREFEWRSVTPFSFDNIFEALNTLLQVSTTEGWVDLAYACADSRGIDQHPVRDHAFHWVFFFVAFEVIMTFFIMKLFAGVIIESFQQRKLAYGDNASLTTSQKEWVETRKFMTGFAPLKLLQAPSHPLRDPVFRFMQRYHRAVDSVMLVCILGNTMALAVVYFGASDAYLLALERVNIAFVLVFCVEAMLKLVAYGSLYWRDYWNVFDFVIVFASVIGVLVSAAGIGSMVAAIRVGRVLRMLRLIKRLHTLQLLFERLLLSLPGVGNIAALLMLFLFIYAAIGVQLFAPVMLQSTLSEHANFQSFGTAVLTLFRSTTGESWNYIMDDLATKDPACDAELLTRPWSYKQQLCGFSNHEDCIPITGCGLPWVARVYYQTFTLFVTNVFMGLFAVFILEGFAIADARAAAVLSKSHMRAFQLVWQKYDPMGHGLVHFQVLDDIMRDLPAPLGFQGKAVTERHLRRLYLHIPAKLYRNCMVTFWDVARHLAILAYDNAAKAKNDVFLAEDSQLRVVEPTKLTPLAKGYMSAFAACPTLQTYYAAVTIQRMFRVKHCRVLRRKSTRKGKDKVRPHA